MQSHDLFRSSAPAFPDSVSTDIQSQLSMLYALAQQQLASSSSSSSSPSDFKNKRFKKSMSLSNDLPTQVPFISATDSAANEREVVKVVTTAGPQAVDKDFLNQLLTRKDVIPARKRRDFIPNDLKDDHYWERRRKNNLAAKRSREKRRLNDIVLETKVVELTNENETLKAKLQLMLSRLNMKETDMEHLFEEEQRLGHICLKPTTLTSAIFPHLQDDHDEHLTMSSSETHDEDEAIPHHENAVDLTRSDVKTGNLLTKSPSPLTPSPSPPNESLLQILASQMLKAKQEPSSHSRLLTIASPPAEQKETALRQEGEDEDDDQQQKWDEAAMTLLSLNKPPLPPPSSSVPTPVEQQQQQQAALQSVINGLLRKPNPPKATIDYHSHPHAQQIQGENFHFDQWKTLMNYFSMSATQQSSVPSNFPSDPAHPLSSHEFRGDMMPLKLRMKMLNTRS